MVIYAARNSFYMVYLMNKMIDNLTDEELANIRKLANEICKGGFKIKSITDESSEKAFKKHSRQPLDSRTRYILIEIHKLRDEIARKSDENSEYVCPTATLVQISLEKPINRSKLKIICSSYEENSFLSEHFDRVVKIIKQGTEISFRLDDVKIHQKEGRHGKNSRKGHNNFEIQSPDGSVLEYISKSKAD